MPTIYIDTNIFSALYYRGRNDISLALKRVTRAWWDSEGASFELCSSRVTELELRGGKYWSQKPAVAACQRLRYLPVNALAKTCSQLYLTRRLVPETKPVDALQLAIATAHDIDYLLTWNHAHLANPETQNRLVEVNAQLELRTPELVTPQSIPWASLGQAIRRRRS